MCILRSRFYERIRSTTVFDKVSGHGHPGPGAQDEFSNNDSKTIETGPVRVVQMSKYE